MRLFDDGIRKLFELLSTPNHLIFRNLKSPINFTATGKFDGQADMNTNAAIEALFKLLQRSRFDYSNEKSCQIQIARYLDRQQVDFKREYRLDDGICDFYFPNSKLVLEVKIATSCSKTQVFRQCESYCKDPSVSGLILGTGRFQGLPNVIHGKPTKVVQFGLGFL